MSRLQPRQRGAAEGTGQARADGSLRMPAYVSVSFPGFLYVAGLGGVRTDLCGGCRISLALCLPGVGQDVPGVVGSVPPSLLVTGCGSIVFIYSLAFEWWWFLYLPKVEGSYM